MQFGLALVPLVQALPSAVSYLSEENGISLGFSYFGDMTSSSKCLDFRLNYCLLTNPQHKVYSEI